MVRPGDTGVEMGPACDSTKRHKARGCRGFRERVSVNAHPLPLLEGDRSAQTGNREIGKPLMPALP